MKDFLFMWICGTVCALLGMAAGRYLDAQKSADLEPVVIEPQVDTLSEWQVLEMAIAYTESRFNPDALGASRDGGVLQITPIYVREVNRLAGTEYTHEDTFDPVKSVEMFEIMQSFKNPSKNIDSAIYYHNKAPWYRAKVLQNMELIRRMEETRKIITNFEDYETGE